MKTNKLLFGKGFIPGMFPFVVLAFLFAVFFQTCQLQKDELVQNVPQLKSGSITNNQSVIFYGHEKFIRDSGKPVAVKKKIGSENLSRFEPNFVVHIVNGDGKTNLVSAAIVKIDGKIIFNASDFSQQVTSLTKDITGLTENSELEVELRSAPGSYLDLWIEGTLKPLPELTTTAVTGLTFNSAISGGIVTSDGGTTISVRGVCWSTSTNPIISDSHTSDGTGTGAFTSSLTGLTASTTYFVRAYATNSVGTAYGNEISFTTSSASTTVTDIDGNVYHTVTIGTQVWMVENLKTTKYRNGDPIPNINDVTSWIFTKSGAYCNYNNDVNNSTTYGRLYNWYAVNDSRNIAPTGWHVPTDAEWTTLTTYLGGVSIPISGDVSIAGGKLKETGTTHWETPNTGATNETGFTALPGGYRYYDGSFHDVGRIGNWWSSTKSIYYGAWYRGMYYNGSFVLIHNDDEYLGFSVRCVRD